MFPTPFTEKKGLEQPLIETNVPPPLVLFIRTGARELLSEEILLLVLAKLTSSESVSPAPPEYARGPPRAPPVLAAHDVQEGGGGEQA